MATTDDLGVNQTRVLDPTNRSFESVVYQRKKPPLSCEVNLTSRLASDHARDVFGAMCANGWNNIGSIKDDVLESEALAGDVICSSSYSANTFKLISTDRGIDTGALAAWVNGEKVTVDGATITLPDPPTNAANVNFVFLEVWRRLITPSDTVYKNGNILGTTSLPNDLIDPAVSIETSLRIQVQYRIRVVADVNITDYPDGFNPSTVFLQGPLPNPLSGSNYFSPVPDSPGLWRAGTGDLAAQQAIGTVDGYTYAIPMFVITRRNTNPYDPQYYANGSGRSLTDYLAGKASDRPDDKYNNWIVASDILDLRHKIIINEDMKDLCQEAFQKTIRGKLRGKMAESLMGEDHFGTSLVHLDAITSNNDTWYQKIGWGDGVRRVFCNAEITQPDTLARECVTDKTGGIVGDPWISGDSVTILPPAVTPLRPTIQSVDEVYVTDSSNEKTAVIYPRDFITISSGSDATSFLSSDGNSWVPNDSTVIADATIFGSVIGDKYVAVGEKTACAVIYNSLDGITWHDATTISATTSATTFHGATWNTNLYVAVGNKIYISPDGVDWTYSASFGVIYNAVTWGGGQFVAVGSDVLTSPDGITWTPHSTGHGFLNGVIWDGNQYVAVGNAGTILTSSDGTSWTLQTYGVSSDLNAICYQDKGTNKYVAVGALGTIIYSDDSLTWDSVDLGIVATDFHSISWSGTEYLAVGIKDIGYYSNDSLICSSPDGYNWSIAALPTTDTLYTITCGNIAVKIDPSGLFATGTILSTALHDYPLTFDYTLHFNSGLNGFTYLPEKVLEFRTDANDSSSIASINQDIRVRTADAIVTDATYYAMLSNKGGNDTEYYNFGHQMSYHVIGTAGPTLTFDRNLYGYDILGVASIYDGTNYIIPTSVSRTSTQYTITDSTTFSAGKDYELNLYIKGKFFQTSRQGRGIVETYEMKEYTPDETADGVKRTFHIDTTNRAIIKMASSYGYDGTGIAYVNGSHSSTGLITSNANFPVDSTKSRIEIVFSSAPVAKPISVPLLIKSAIENTEGYICYYDTVPYQGWLGLSAAQGEIETEGSPIITTAGSGNITNVVTGTTGSAFFTKDSTTVYGSGTNWLSTAKPGYTINKITINKITSDRKFIIKDVISDLELSLASPCCVDYGSITPISYEISSLDRPDFNQANIIDRMQTYDATNDAAGYSDGIGTLSGDSDPTIETKIIARVQDIMDQPSENISIGDNGYAGGRGRSTIHIDGDDMLGLGNLGLKYESLSVSGKYQKAYQPYVFNKDCSGELYLMVVGSETNNNNNIPSLNEKSNIDSVDIFRIPGRPLTVRRKT